MKENQVVAVLAELGWRAGKDEVGDRFCVMELDDRQVLVIPTVRKASDHLRVTLMPSISTEEFSAAVSFISGDRGQGGHEPIIATAALKVAASPSRRRDEAFGGSCLVGAFSRCREGIGGISKPSDRFKRCYAIETLGSVGTC